MKALTIKQPWSDAIVHRSKRTENRTWTRTYRGRILIHAGVKEDRHAILPFGENAARGDGLYPDVRSAIIGIATLSDIHFADGCCQPWGESDVYHWVLTDVVALPEPVPCKGRLQLWKPSEDVLAAVAAQPLTPADEPN